MALEKTAPPHNSMYDWLKELTADLTGRISKAEDFAFACGGSSYIWRGWCVQVDDRNTNDVRTYFLTLRLF
jgi:hypothetical protein